MAGNLCLLYYKYTLGVDERYLQLQLTPSISSIENQLLVDFYRQSRWEEILLCMAKSHSLSYLHFKLDWSELLDSILLIQQLARCDRDAKEFTRRGQQIFMNIERLLHTSDRTLCKQFADHFRNCADYNELCSEEEIRTFWPSI